MSEYRAALDAATEFERLSGDYYQRQLDAQQAATEVDDRPRPPQKLAQNRKRRR